MSKSVKIGLAIVSLLAVLAITQSLLTDVPDAAKKQAPAKQADHHGKGKKGSQKVALPAPMGSPDAPVKIRVFVTSSNECDSTTLSGMKQIGERFGKDVYIEYSDLVAEDAKKQAEAAKLTCKSGITINGKSQFILPERGLNGTVMLDGPMGEKNYKMQDIEAIVAHLIKRHNEDAGHKRARSTE